MSTGLMNATRTSQNDGLGGGTGKQGRRIAGWGHITAFAAGVLGLALASFSALADQPGEWEYGHHGMWGGGWGWGWGGMLFGLIMMLLVIAAIVAVVVLVVRALGGQGTAAAKSARRSPMAILEERFAHGEIDVEEFEARRRALNKDA